MTLHKHNTNRSYANALIWSLRLCTSPSADRFIAGRCFLFISASLSINYECYRCSFYAGYNSSVIFIVQFFWKFIFLIDLAINFSSSFDEIERFLILHAFCYAYNAPDRILMLTIRNTVTVGMQFSIINCSNFEKPFHFSSWQKKSMLVKIALHWLM